MNEEREGYYSEIADLCHDLTETRLQRDALTTKIRKRISKDQAQAWKARGEVPGFMKGRK